MHTSNSLTRRAQHTSELTFIYNVCLKVTLNEKICTERTRAVSQQNQLISNLYGAYFTLTEKTEIVAFGGLPYVINACLRHLIEIHDANFLQVVQLKPNE